MMCTEFQACPDCGTAVTIGRQHVCLKRLRIANPVQFVPEEPCTMSTYAPDHITVGQGHCHKCGTTWQTLPGAPAHVCPMEKPEPAPVAVCRRERQREIDADRAYEEIER